MIDCDVAIIGAGPGGEAAAQRAAIRGAKVCLIEAGGLGGTCLNVGCIPTKAMLHASELARAFGEAGQLGLRLVAQPLVAQPLVAQPFQAVPLEAQALVAQPFQAVPLEAQALVAQPFQAVPLAPAPPAQARKPVLPNTMPIGVDGPAFMKRVHDVVATLAKGLSGKYKTLGVQVLAGRATRIEGQKGRTGEGEPRPQRLSAPEGLSPPLPLSPSPHLFSVHVDLAGGGEETVSAGSVIIATGSRPSRLPGLPWESGCVWTTDQAIQADDLPQSVLIIGGGIIGCEFATMYSELGIPVTMVEMLDRLAAVLDEDASKLVARSLRRRNVTVYLGSPITSMTADQRGLTATLADGKTIHAARALVAVGRRANINGLGLEPLGVKISGGVIAVDDHCRTSVPGIYAIGDAAHKSQYAHLAARMGVIAAENATGLDTSDDMTVVPAGVFTHPEVATVGLNEADARKQYPNVRTASVQYQATGIGWAYNQRDGLAKIIADSQTGQIYGGLVVGYHAADVIQEIALAMRHNLSVEHLANTIHAHPTFCEAVQLAARLWLDEKGRGGEGETRRGGDANAPV
jgi:dihydrolipoamide dehydrogenase